MIGYPTIDAQVASMARTWPQMGMVRHSEREVVWVGKLQPLMQTYIVSISHLAPSVIETLDLRKMQPLVSILDPPLRPRRNDPEGQLPHVYYTGPGALDAILCLFDPDGREWSPDMLIAETTVPWTIDWLVAYEGWRATGKWKATGKHLSPEARAIG